MDIPAVHYYKKGALPTICTETSNLNFRVLEVNLFLNFFSNETIHDFTETPYIRVYNTL